MKIRPGCLFANSLRLYSVDRAERASTFSQTSQFAHGGGFGEFTTVPNSFIADLKRTITCYQRNLSPHAPSVPIAAFPAGHPSREHPLWPQKPNHARSNQ